jgi:DNA-binding MarR family transcriptional regulator
MMATRVATSADAIEAELMAVAERCRVLADKLGMITEAAIKARQAGVGDFTAFEVRQYLRARRLREALFPDGLFADPAWDILLDLYASEVEGQSVVISSACVAACVPPTTALRWLGRLEELDLICRADDPCDHRRSFVRLTEPAKSKIQQWLTTANFHMKERVGRACERADDAGPL